MRTLARLLRRIADWCDPRSSGIHNRDEFINHVATELDAFDDGTHQWSLLLSGKPPTWASLFEVGVYMSTAQLEQLWHDGEINGLEAYALQTVRPVVCSPDMKDDRGR